MDIHTLIRDVLDGSPDGKSVQKTQVIEVGIEWPNDMPAVPYFGTAGEWRVLTPESKANP